MSVFVLEWEIYKKHMFPTVIDRVFWKYGHWITSDFSFCRHRTGQGAFLSLFFKNNIFFFFFSQKESIPHWGFITKFRGDVNDEGMEEKNGQGQGANVFEILILKDEKKGINYDRMVILMNNIVSRQPFDTSLGPFQGPSSEIGSEILPESGDLPAWVGRGTVRLRS